MQGNWRIGSLLGIPFYIDPSWLVILILVTVVNATDINTRGLSSGSPIWGWVVGLVMALLLFASVLLHELGHSLVARAQGIQVNSITLFLFGGIAAIERESKTPEGAFLVAIAGPLVSIVLFFLFSVLTQAATEVSLLQLLLGDLARINLVLAVFNLIPGLPLDGGQVFKALVWKLTGNRFVGVHWASASGRLFGWFGISVGLYFFFLTGQPGSLWIGLIGWFVLRNANAYEKLTSLQEILLEVVAAEVMTREFRVVNANLTLRDFAEEYVLSDLSVPLTYYAAAEGRYRGLVKVSDLQLIERSEWDSRTLADIVHPLTVITSVGEKTPLFQVIAKLEESGDLRLSVLSLAGAVAGVIDRGDIVRAIAAKQNLPIPEAEIKRIKAEGTYPLGFNLPAIAQTLQNQ